MNNRLGYESALEVCSEIISRVEQITESYERLLREDGIELRHSIKELDTSPFERSRSKMRFELIKIAVCGAFSSGKSFLISALIDRLEWYEREAGAEDIFEDRKQDGYSTFLPTAPEQTNSCPLEAIPSEEEYSRFEVMFGDTKAWEDKSGFSASDDEITRKMLAYATDIEQWRNARPSQDIPRTAVRARLHVSKMPIPAIIHDLPGIGGAGEIYLETVHQALRQVDYIVYVASAIKELTDAELLLLRFVEEISEQDRIPVIFVLSQIDRQSEWMRVLQKNNQFLREYFTKDGKVNKAFIGKGFIPISAGAEAKARGLFERGAIDSSERDRVIERSGMRSFRQLLLEHLTNHSGPAHLREIALHMHGILKSLSAHIANSIQAEIVPLEDAEEMVRESRELSFRLTEKKKALLEDLEQLGKETLLAGFASTDADDLYQVLREEVEPLIDRLDVTKQSDRDKLQQEIKKTRDKWLKRQGVGFIDAWNQAWNHYQKQTIILLNERVEEAVKEASITYPIPLADSRLPELTLGVDPKDVLELVKIALQVSAGVTTVGSGLLASTVIVGGTAVALGPVGFFLIAAGASTLLWALIKRRSDAKKLRKLFIEYLPKYSSLVVGHLRDQARDDLAKHSGNIINIVNRLISDQQDRIATLENRLRTGDLQAHQVRIGLLRGLGSECQSVEQAIQDFYSVLATLQQR